MRQTSLYGLALAAFGTLFLTPDALFMRLSEMHGFQMSAWRGLLMGSVMVAIWALTSRDRAGDIAQLRSVWGLAIIICQFFNSLLFCLGIATAPAAVVLFGVAAVPVFAALLSWAVLGEPARALTWGAIVAVLTGIGIAVLGDPGQGADGQGAALNLAALLGALAGLGTAMALALNFVILRARPGLPIMLVIGCGALAAGVNGLIITGPAQMLDGNPWAMAVTGAIILPVSFFALSLASRHTHAANVSLLMLMETVLGPFWVWLGVGERPTPNMILGGVIVVVSLAIYLTLSGRAPRVRQGPG